MTSDSLAEPFTSEDAVANARGRVLGGNNAINAGFYSRADRDFFRNSRFHWNLDLLNRSYEWIEKTVVFRPQMKKWQSSIRDGLLEANVTPYNGYNLNHVLGTRIGGSTFDSFGRRHTTADLLTHARPLISGWLFMPVWNVSCSIRLLPPMLHTLLIRRNRRQLGSFIAIMLGVNTVLSNTSSRHFFSMLVPNCYTTDKNIIYKDVRFELGGSYIVLLALIFQCLMELWQGIFPWICR